MTETIIPCLMTGQKCEHNCLADHCELAADVDGFVPGARPICVFCNAEWTDRMIYVYDIDAQHGPDSYDFGPENQRATLDIICENCNRLIYRKEFRGD
jgi:hypothetical protein